MSDLALVAPSDARPSAFDSTQLEAIEALLPAAVEAGAVDDLLELSARADVARLYELHRGYVAMANRIGRLKVLAESGLGKLIRDGRPIDGLQRWQRHAWASFSVASERGALENVVTRVAETQDVSTNTVRLFILRNGISYIPTASIREPLRADIKRRGCTVREYARLIGEDERRVRYLAGKPGSGYHHKNRKNDRTSWDVACGVIETLRIDPDTLPFAPTPNGGSRGSYQADAWLTRERKRTGSRWDECYVRLRRCLDEFKELAPNGDPRYDDAYAHFYALETLLGQKMRRAR